MNVKLPRFLIEDTLDLVDDLKDLGVEDVLTPDKADFSNMVSRNLVYLSQLTQKARIEIKEGWQPGLKTSGKSMF